MTIYDRAYEVVLAATLLSAVVALLLFLGAGVAGFLGLPGAYTSLSVWFNWSVVVFAGLYLLSVLLTLANPNA